MKAKNYDNFIEDTLIEINGLEDNKNEEFNEIEDNDSLSNENEEENNLQENII